MKEIIKVFSGKDIRCFSKNGDPFFSITDVCNALDLSNPSVVSTQIKKDYISNTYVIDSLKRKQKIIIINEYGLYEIIFKSRKEEAKKFKEWVFEEVLPSIRKTGEYSITKEIRKKSIDHRKFMTDQWKEHGIKEPKEYAKLTIEEYRALFNNVNIRKENMDKKQILLLSALESMEALKLICNPDIEGFIDLKNSIYETKKIISDKIVKNITDNN